VPLWTTYLAFLRKVDYNPLRVFPNELKETIFKYIMRNRGNNEVAPSKELLTSARNGKISWEEYSEKYTAQIRDSLLAHIWMRKVAEETQRANVVLICFEKDASRCHRTLLANNIVFLYSSVDYRGELKEYFIPSFTKKGSIRFGKNPVEWRER